MRTTSLVRCDDNDDDDVDDYINNKVNYKFVLHNLIKRFSMSHVRVWQLLIKSAAVQICWTLHLV